MRNPVWVLAGLVFGLAVLQAAPKQEPVVKTKPGEAISQVTKVPADSAKAKAKPKAAASDDPYGVSVPAADSTKAKVAVVPISKDSLGIVPKDSAVAKLDSTKVKMDSVVKTVAVDSVRAKPDSLMAPKDSLGAKALGAVSDSIKDTTQVKPARRPRIVRETQVNSLDDMKGAYRSPKRALFMSLILPGLGQAYVGKSALNYFRAAGYLALDATFGVLWYQYSIKKHNRQVDAYRTFADGNFVVDLYEKNIEGQKDKTKGENPSFERINPFRESYCEIVQDQSTQTGRNYFNGCVGFYKTERDGDYKSFTQSISESGLAPEAVAEKRKQMPETWAFYEIIAKEQEFISGWKDAKGIIIGDSSITGTSEFRAEYIDMRASANRYARMQAWFLGGIVINHLVSALDAAITAQLHNKALYQSDVGDAEVSWLERFRVDGGLAFEGTNPITRLNANWSF